MDFLFSQIILFVNICFMMGGLYAMKVMWEREGREMKEYRKMTDLEIRLLAKRLNEISGISCQR